MRMAIVGSNPRAGGSECIIFGHVGSRNHRFEPITLDMRGQERKGGELSAYGGWDVREMRPGASLAKTPALVGGARADDYCRTTGRLLLVSHSWSGRLQINDIGRKYTIDLYSETTRLALLDVVHEIMVDVTALAAVENGVLGLPAMTVETLIKHVLENSAWFRFLDRDADFDPGPLRRTIEVFRREPAARLRWRLLSALVPVLAARPPLAAPAAPSPAQDESRLADEVRLLAAAVEGLALRAAAQA
jgi:hypothetical protein